jgi:hypothetical protein
MASFLTCSMSCPVVNPGARGSSSPHNAGLFGAQLDSPLRQHPGPGLIQRSRIHRRMNGRHPRHQIMRQPELRIGRPPSENEGGADLICRELIRCGHPGQLVIRTNVTQPDFDHSGHQPSSFMIYLPVPCLEHLDTVITRQPRQLNPRQDTRQSRPGAISATPTGISCRVVTNITLQHDPDNADRSYQATHRYRRQRNSTHRRCNRVRVVNVWVT